MGIMVAIDTRIYGIYRLHVYRGTYQYQYTLTGDLYIFKSLFSQNGWGFLISMGSLNSSFSQEALIKWQQGHSFTFKVTSAHKRRRSLP